MLQVPSEPIESPADDYIDLSSARCRDESVERRAPIFGPTDTSIDLLDGGPAASFDVPPNFRQLILRFLLERRYARIDCGSHRSRPFL